VHEWDLVVRELVVFIVWLKKRLAAELQRQIDALPPTDPTTP